jgi:hypothetical protein
MTENNSIKIVRLQSGVDIIADVEEYFDDQIIRLVNPMILYFKRSKIGSIMMVSPWLPVELIHENITNISHRDVLTILDPKDKLIEYYKEMVNIHLAEWLKNSKDMFDNFSTSDHYEDDYGAGDAEMEDEMGMEEFDTEEIENLKKNNLLH